MTNQAAQDTADAAGQGQRPPLPLFSRETALAKVQAAEDACRAFMAAGVDGLMATDLIRGVPVVLRDLAARAKPGEAIR